MGHLNILVVICLVVVVQVNADVYLHNPPGGNNRLNGKNRNRKNNNRMFDSQNNNRGGYNVGDDGETEGKGTLTYIGGSFINIQWTNQHECGGPNSGCDIVIQYMCSDTLKDGTSTRTPSERDDKTERGLHEDQGYYEQCKGRMRDYNLYQADQKLKRKDARSTRQNPNGARSGLECPEERDYYPYHAPTPWKDIAILTNNVKKCKDLYEAQSQNVIKKGYCTRAKGLQPITEKDCKAANGRWKFKDSHGLPAPDCLQAPKSRDNHLGNTQTTGNGDEKIPKTLSYNWKVPDINEVGCVLRIRYNISIGDYDPFKVDASHNENKAKINLLSGEYKLSAEEAEDRGYILENDPEIQPFQDFPKLDFQLAFNTAQTGRTFEDRTHKFRITKRENVEDLTTSKPVHNLNVIGKRGNIVQVYPAVEYGFEPAILKVERGDYVLPQWTGSLNNPKNNDGEGAKGEDKSNIIAMTTTPTKYKRTPSKTMGHPATSYPLKFNSGTFLGADNKMAVKLAFPKKENNEVLTVPEPSAKYSYIGCYRDKRQRAIGDGFLGFSKYPENEVIQKCANKAKKAGYKVFGVQNKRECFTAADAHLTYMEYGRTSGCRDGKGGGYRNSVYTLDDKRVATGGSTTTTTGNTNGVSRPRTGAVVRPVVRMPYVSLGCYRDKRQRAIGGTMTRYSSWKVIRECLARAKAAGYQVFAVQNKKECFTAPDAHLTYMKYGRRRGCRGGRGGGWRNSVYRVVNKDAPQESDETVNSEVKDVSTGTLQQIADSLTKTEEKIEEILEEIENDVSERKRRDEEKEDDKMIEEKEDDKMIETGYDDKFFNDIINDTLIDGGRRRRRRSVDNDQQQDDQEKQDEEQEQEDEDDDDDDDDEEVLGEREKRGQKRDAAKLDNAPALVSVGVVQANTCGTFNYLCTRNNNFSNRSQKGRVVVCA